MRLFALLTIGLRIVAQSRFQTFAARLLPRLASVRGASTVRFGARTIRRSERATMLPQPVDGVAGAVVRQRLGTVEVGEDDSAVGEPRLCTVCAAEAGEPVLIGPVGVHEEELAVAVDVGGVGDLPAVG